jgi:polar amino acid transport system substrate-binding protein
MLLFMKKTNSRLHLTRMLAIVVACGWIPGLFLILSLVSARGQSSPGPSPLRIGVTPEFPPMIYKEGDKITGVEADFAQALGQELGRPIKFVEVSWEDQIPALAEGRTDIIMSTMSITPARELRVAFAKPYLLIGQTVLVRREDANNYVFGFPAVPKGTIGVIKATTGDFLVQQEFPKSKRKEFKSAQDAAKALEKKKIDLFISDSPTVWWLAGMNEVQGLVVVRIFLSQEQLAWAVSKSNPELLQSVNNALEKMQKDGRAAAIIKRWIPLFQ